MSKDWTERSLGELVLERPERSVALERFGLDYCCGGAERLGAACGRKGIPVAAVLAALERADELPEREDPAWQASPVAAVRHIVDTHHAYTREVLPRLVGLARKVAQVHGQEDPRLHQLDAAMSAFAQETLEHMDKEERILFPMIEGLAAGRLPTLPPTVQFPIACMLREHEQHGERLQAFRNLTDDYVPPVGACNSWRALLAGLEQLELDLHRHIHKENSFLFPLAIELERKAS